jgi:hypothetical protein
MSDGKGIQKQEKNKNGLNKNKLIMHRRVDMREIGFRGRRKDTGKWVYGYYVVATKHYIFTGKTGLSQAVPGHVLMYRDFERYEVILETIGQYTGVMAAKSYRGDKPKNRKIFVWDIVGFVSFYYGKTEMEEIEERDNSL